MINDAKYTVRLRTLLNDPRVKPLIDKAMSTYPLYQAKNEVLYGVIPTREELNKKILDFYKYYEIGFETPGRFIDELEISLNEIMPFYNQKYKSIDIMNGIDDIFGNLDVTETFSQESKDKATGNSKVDSTGSTKDDTSGTSKSNTEVTSTSEANSESKTDSETNSYNKNVSSQTPQTNISLQNKDIDSVEYADKIDWNHTTGDDTSKNTGHDTTNSNSKTDSTGETSQHSTGETSQQTTSENSSDRENLTTHTLNRKGNQGVNTYAHDMLEFRELALNIEQMIINDPRIRELFMLIW